MQAEVRRPWHDGDCGAFLARWFAARGGYMPDAKVKAYQNFVVDRWADLFRMVCRACRTAGLAETNIPTRGDVGVIRAGNAVLAAICTGDGWASRTKSGLLVVREATVFRAWKIP